MFGKLLRRNRDIPDLGYQQLGGDSRCLLWVRCQYGRGDGIYHSWHQMSVPVVMSRVIHSRTRRKCRWVMGTLPLMALLRFCCIMTLYYGLWASSAYLSCIALEWSWDIGQTWGLINYLGQVSISPGLEYHLDCPWNRSIYCADLSSLMWYTSPSKVKNAQVRITVL